MDTKIQNIACIDKIMSIYKFTSKWRSQTTPFVSQFLCPSKSIKKIPIKKINCWILVTCGVTVVVELLVVFH